MVHVDETTPIRGVLLTFFGRMTIYWKTVGGGGTQEFCEIEDYLDEKVIFWTIIETIITIYETILWNANFTYWIAMFTWYCAQNNQWENIGNGM